MNKIYCFLMLFIVQICLFLSVDCFSITKKTTIDYTFTAYKDGNKGDYMSVCMEFSGDSSGSTTLLMPQVNLSEGMSINFESDIGSIVVIDEEKETTINNISLNFITLRHTPNAKIKATYHVNSSSVMYFGEDGDMMFSGHALIFLKSSKINLTGINNGKTYIINSKGIINNPDKLMDSEEAMNSWYYIGNKDITTHHIDGFKNYIIIKIGEKPKHDFIDIIGKTILSCENFITYVSQKNDFTNGKKNIIIMDGVHAPFYGTKTDNTYFVVYSKKDTLTKLATSLAHELLHYLFGNKFIAKFPNNTGHFGYWFNEGFNYYYSSLLLYESAVLTLPEYLEIINVQMKEYYKTSAPLKSFINETYSCTGNQLKLNSSFSDYLVHSLHGFMVAHNLDNLLKIKSNDKYSLKELLKSLLSSCISPKCYFSKTEFLKSIDILSVDKKKARWFENFINLHIVDGKPIFPISPILDGKANIDYQCCDDVFDVGFNVSQTMCNGVVFGINHNSSVYRLGLRDGDKITSIDVMPKKVSLIIDNRDNPITYEPIIRSIIPKYIKTEKR